MEKREGIPRQEGATKIWLKDSKGLVVKDRPTGGINEHKEQFAHVHQPMEDLGEIVKELKPSVIIGAAAQPAVFPANPHGGLGGNRDSGAPDQEVLTAGLKRQPRLHSIRTCCLWHME